MPMFSSSTASVTTMLSLRVIAFLSASLVSLVPGKKYLVETDDSDAQIDHDLVETKSKSKNRFVGFGHGGSNQAASLIQEFGSDYSDHGIVNGGSGNQAANVNQDHGNAYGGSNQAANVIQDHIRGYGDPPSGNQDATVNQDHGNAYGGSGNQAANVIQDHTPAYGDPPSGNQDATINRGGSGNQAANVIQNRARASVPKLPSIDIFKNPKQDNIRPKNRLGLIDFLYQRSPTTLSEKPFE